MPEFTRHFTLTADGTITVEAENEQEADAKIKLLDAHTLIKHIDIDDPYESVIVEVGGSSEDDYDDSEDE